MYYFSDLLSVNKSFVCQTGSSVTAFFCFTRNGKGNSEQTPGTSARITKNFVSFNNSCHLQPAFPSWPFPSGTKNISQRVHNSVLYTLANINKSILQKYYKKIVNAFSIFQYFHLKIKCFAKNVSLEFMDLLPWLLSFGDLKDFPPKI